MNLTPSDKAGANQPLSVSQLNRQSKLQLESQFENLWVEGEISNFKAYHNGHWFFTLKDKQAQIACTMFNNQNRRLKLTPDNGQQVLIRGRVSLYETRGTYQLICEHLQASGDGLLQLAFEQLKTKLQAQGLFEPARKKPLPAYPAHIGVITASKGAVIRDILTVLQRRFANIKVTVFPVAVQGENAAEQICQAISLANQVRFKTPLEALILARGGGSLEDLQAFNLEPTALAIAQSELPIISAVGHETDTSISDWVADARAPTPSAAAELISPDARELLKQLRAYELQLLRLWQQQYKYQQLQLKHLKQRLISPQQYLISQYQRLNDLEQSIERNLSAQLKHKQQQLSHLQQRLKQQNPKLLLQQQQQSLQQHQNLLEKAVQGLLEKKKQNLGQQLQLLNNLSPLQTLARGYSISRLPNGRVIEAAEQLKVGDTMITLLSEGEVQSRIIEKNT